MGSGGIFRGGLIQNVVPTIGSTVHQYLLNGLLCPFTFNSGLGMFCNRTNHNKTHTEDVSGISLNCWDLLFNDKLCGVKSSMYRS